MDWDGGGISEGICNPDFGPSVFLGNVTVGVRCQWQKVLTVFSEYCKAVLINHISLIQLRLTEPKGFKGRIVKWSVFFENCDKQLLLVVICFIVCHLTILAQPIGHSEFHWERGSISQYQAKIHWCDDLNLLRLRAGKELKSFLKAWGFTQQSDSFWTCSIQDILIAEIQPGDVWGHQGWIHVETILQVLEELAAGHLGVFTCTGEFEIISRQH